MFITLINLFLFIIIILSYFIFILILLLLLLFFYLFIYYYNYYLCLLDEKGRSPTCLKNVFNPAQLILLIRPSLFQQFNFFFFSAKCVYIYTHKTLFIFLTNHSPSRFQVRSSTASNARHRRRPTASFATAGPG